MQKIRATKTVSMTEMRDPKKVLEFAAGETVAVMNRNKVVGYFASADSVESNAIRYASNKEVDELSKQVIHEYADALEYLRDK